MSLAPFGKATIKYDGKSYTFSPTLRDIADFERAGHNVFTLAGNLSKGIVDAACLAMFMGDVAVLAGCPADGDIFYRVICGQVGEDAQNDLRDSMASVFEAVIPSSTPTTKKKPEPEPATQQ